MEEPTRNGRLDRLLAFLDGTYPGAPIAYVMAIAIVLVMMLVTAVQILTAAAVAALASGLATPILVLSQLLLLH